MNEGGSSKTAVLIKATDNNVPRCNTEEETTIHICRANPDTPEREEWRGRFDFLISCIGYCVGLGNVWKFPYLCYKNGGGAFLIPYILTVVVAGIPMYFLELALGQYHRKGALGVWDDMPGFKGIGYSFLVITFWCNVYYAVIIAWSLWYLFHSFRLVLPWSTCDNKWNTPHCINNFQRRLASGCGNLTMNSTVRCDVTWNTTVTNSSTAFETPETEFWNDYTLDQSSGIEEPGDIHWQMALLLLLAWIVCYFCIWKSVKWSGKIVYVTALFPYVVIIGLLCRGATLPGAVDGIKFYLYPQIHRLKDSQVWVDAASQVFYSTGVGFGAVIVMGSYNNFNHNIYKSAVVVATINSCTSLTVGFVIFSVLGFMAHRLGQSVADVTASGPGLAFVVYPSALSELPGAPIWASLFFIMLFMVGLDTQFGMMEGLYTSIIDEFPEVLRKRREVFIGISCFVSFLIGLSMVTEGGIYVFQLFDWYSCSRLCLLFVVFWESVAVGWFYGADRFYGDIVKMIGMRPTVIFKYCWIIAIPIICSGVFLFSLVSYTPVTYHGLEFPTWAEVVGWFLTLSSILCIPAVMIVQILRTKGTLRQRINLALFPSEPGGVSIPEKVPLQVEPL